MEILKKKSLFWDVEGLDAQKDGRFIIGRILNFGDTDDFKWLVKFYGVEKIKQELLSNRQLDKKSFFSGRNILI